MTLHRGYDTEHASFDPTLLRIAADLRRLGVEPCREHWHRVRRGVWIEADSWAALTHDQKHQAFTHATVLCMRDPDSVVVTGHSAASLWGMPRIEPWPRHISVLDDEGRRTHSRYVRPRPGEPVDPVAIDGRLVTPVARTIVDLACTGTLDTALAAADHALAHKMCTVADLVRETDSLVKGARGIGAAGLVVALADGLSGSPGESVSRLQMYRDNFPRPALQRRYRDAEGPMDADFDFVGLIGEFDGKLKYKVPPGISAEEAGEVVWREKLREDRLRRFKPVARWTWDVARSTAALARHLMDHGLKPQPRNAWIDLGSNSQGRPG